MRLSILSFYQNIYIYILKINNKHNICLNNVIFSLKVSWQHLNTQKEILQRTRLNKSNLKRKIIFIFIYNLLTHI